MRWLIILASLLFLMSCGDDPLTTAPTPEPSATPPPDHAALCEIRDSYIYVTRGGNQVVSWPLGAVPTAHVRPRYAGESDPQFDLDECTAFDQVRWYGIAGAPVLFVGDQSAPDVSVKIDHEGFWCFEAQPLAPRTEASRFCATVLGLE